jgi:hypothetical protein
MHAHGAVASHELGRETVDAVNADLETAPIREPLRAVLRFLKLVTLGTPTAGDVRAAYASGVSRVQLEEALEVAFCFNVIDRLADTFEFHVGSPASFASAAKMLLERGYKM